jgi:hypothetical protein
VLCITLGSVICISYALQCFAVECTFLSSYNFPFYHFTVCPPDDPSGHMLKKTTWTNFYSINFLPNKISYDVALILQWQKHISVSRTQNCEVFIFFTMSAFLFKKSTLQPVRNHHFECRSQNDLFTLNDSLASISQQIIQWYFFSVNNYWGKDMLNKHFLTRPLSYLLQ